ncbi:MAG: hypothetical protein WC340_18670 [Kiritimatiellia bacterium]
MKQFNYTATNTNGARTSGQITAADRVAALRELRARKLVPLTLDAGAPERKINLSPPRYLKLGLPALAALALVATLVWFLRSKPTAPAPARQQQTLAQPTTIPLGAQPKPPASEEAAPTQLPSTPMAGKTPQPGRQQGTAPPTTAPKIVSDALALAADEEIVPPVPLPPSSFNSLSESALAMIASVPPGMRIPPLPIPADLGEDFQASLTNAILIYEDDSEQTALHKETVALMKQDVATWVKEGHSPADVIKAVQELHNDDAKLNEELNYYLEVLRAGGNEREILDFMEEANKELDGRGLPRLQLKKTTMAERRAAREKQ